MSCTYKHFEQIWRVGGLHLQLENAPHIPAELLLTFCIKPKEFLQ